MCRILVLTSSTFQLRIGRSVKLQHINRTKQSWWSWYLVHPWSKLHISLGRWQLMEDRHRPCCQPGSWTRKTFPLLDCPPETPKDFLLAWTSGAFYFQRAARERETHGADSLFDAGQVDFLPHQSVSVTLVDVIRVDLGAAAVFGAPPGHRDGGAVRAQHGDAVWSAGSCWKFDV